MKAVVRLQGPGAPAPQADGALGQLGKEQTLPCAEDLFSRYGNRLGRHVRAAYKRARAVTAELPETIRGQESGSTETVSEAPGAYGVRGGSHTAWASPYETASALASRPSPEMGMATGHAPSDHHSGLPPILHPVVGPLVPMGRHAPRTGVQTCCCVNRCLCHGLGCHVQRACCFRLLDRSPTSVACQLPRVASSTSCSAPLQGPAEGQARSAQVCVSPTLWHPRPDLWNLHVWVLDRSRKV